MKSFHRILLCALCAFMGTQFLSGAPDIPQRKRLSPASVRVVSANVRFLKEQDKAGGNDWNKRKELARDVLLAQDADIICFQEFEDDHLTFLRKFFPDYDVAGFLENAEKGRRTNTVFYSKKRFEKLGHKGWFLSDAPDEYRSKFSESSSVRHVNGLHLKDRVTGRELVVWNTHFDHKNQAGRDKQAVALLGIAKQFPVAIPQVITGDFNCAANRQAIKTIKAGGFTDTYTAIHGPEEPGFTYHTFVGPKYSGRTTGKIDFVFCNSALRTTAAEIIRDSRDGRYPSDHYFISAELEYAADK